MKSRLYDYCPDKWVVVEVTPEGEEPFLKVFARWSGGYLSGDSWRLNSGVSSVDNEEDGCYYVFSESGTCYRCNKGQYGVAGLSNYGVLETLKKKFGDRLKVLDNPPEAW